jgi:hypothetical protein
MKFQSLLLALAWLSCQEPKSNEQPAAKSSNFASDANQATFRRVTEKISGKGITEPRTDVDCEGVAVVPLNGAPADLPTTYRNCKIRLTEFAVGGVRFKPKAGQNFSTFHSGESALFAAPNGIGRQVTIVRQINDTGDNEAEFSVGGEIAVEGAGRFLFPVFHQNGMQYIFAFGADGKVCCQPAFALAPSFLSFAAPETGFIYANDTGGRVFRADGKKNELVLEQDLGILLIAFAPKPDSLFFTTADSIKRYDLQTKDVTEIKKIAKPAVAITVNRESNYLAWVTANTEQAITELHLMYRSGGGVNAIKLAIPIAKPENAKLHLQTIGAKYALSVQTGDAPTFAIYLIQAVDGSVEKLAPAFAWPEAARTCGEPVEGSCSGEVVAEGTLANANSSDALFACSTTPIRGTCCMFSADNPRNWFLTNGKTQPTPRTCGDSCNRGSSCF